MAVMCMHDNMARVALGLIKHNGLALFNKSLCLAGLSGDEII